MSYRWIKPCIAVCLTFLANSQLFAEDNSIASDAKLINATKLSAYIRFLSDDLLEGRGPGTRGDKLTQLYLSSQFESFGLTHAGETSSQINASTQSWFQQVPLLGITTAQPQTLDFKSANVSIQLKQHADYIAVSGIAEPMVTLPESPIVFVGYGITAPEYQWDDFANIDVRGKIVVVMNNDPEEDPNIFEGRRRLYYGRWDYKFTNAAAHGAVGVFIIHTEASAGYPFSVVQTSWSGEESELRGDTSPRLKMKAWLTEDATRKLFALAGIELDAVRDTAKSRNFQPIDLKVTTGASFTCAVTENDSANVLGTLAGSDPELKSEYVIVMAHHDHIGRAVERDEQGDDIYNGAIDNASGTAAMLSIAQAISTANEHPKRSILFAAVAAEEQGLLGSKYFAANPTIPTSKIAGLVNMDSMNFLGRTIDLQVVGHGKSSIDAIVEEVAKLQGRRVVPDQFIDRGYFYRSDQFSLAKIGVPGLYLHTGTVVRDRPDNWGRERLDEWTKKTYHQPSDAWDATWDLSGMVEDTQLLYEVVLRLANAPQMQSWRPGDEFESIRKKSLDASIP